MKIFYGFLVLVCAVSSVWACGCAKPLTPKDVHSYVHILKGQVLQVINDESNNVVRQTVRFNVLQAIKGPKQQFIEVEFGGSSSCDLQQPNFLEGQIYLISDHDIYLTKDNVGVVNTNALRPSGRFESNYCSLRELLM